MAKKILIVDDDATLLGLYEERLKLANYDVVTAKNGEEALARAVEAKPDLILLDIMMPSVNGFEVLDILKHTTETKNIPVIILTALGQEEHKERGLKAGAADYIVKADIMPADVVKKIESVLSTQP